MKAVGSFSKVAGSALGAIDFLFGFTDDFLALRFGGFCTFRATSSLTLEVREYVGPPS
jgi:hypothetical protein